MRREDAVDRRGSAAPGGRRLRIGIEAHVVNRQPSGNGRVVENLVRAIGEIGGHRLFVYVTDGEVAAAWRRDAPPGTTIRRVHGGRNPFVRIPVMLPALAVKDRLDVFLAHDVRPPVAPCPVVTLVHDVAFERHPEYFSRYELAWMRRGFRYSCRHSDGVIAVSKFTRDEIVSLYGVPAERITVAPNGVDPAFFDPGPRAAPVDGPFFLAVGNLQPRKNLVTLIRAYRSLRGRAPEVTERLVIVGQPGFQADAIHREAADLRSEGALVFTGYLPTESVIGLMQRATAFAYPSVYEGFGLPPLEAMAAGTPTVVSDIPVTREVVGDAGLRVPATDERAWSEALQRVREPALRHDLISRGRSQAAGFTWDRAARAALGALERAAAGA
jgi:glycosyltransferase involved in cell wall biosynthesis